MHCRYNLDAIREEFEGEVAMFATFTGGFIISKLDQIIKILIKSQINRSIARSLKDQHIKAWIYLDAMVSEF